VLGWVKGTGSMSTVRGGCTAKLLPNGQVLVASLDGRNSSAFSGSGVVTGQKQ